MSRSWEKEPIYVEFVAILRELMNGMTTYEYAKITNVARSTISNYLSGKMKPGEKFCRIVADNSSNPEENYIRLVKAAHVESPTKPEAPRIYPKVKELMAKIFGDRSSGELGQIMGYASGTVSNYRYGRRYISDDFCEKAIAISLDPTITLNELKEARSVVKLRDGIATEASEEVSEAIDISEKSAEEALVPDPDVQPEENMDAEDDDMLQFSVGVFLDKIDNEQKPTPDELKAYIKMAAPAAGLPLAEHISYLGSIMLIDIPIVMWLCHSLNLANWTQMAAIIGDMMKPMDPKEVKQLKEQVEELRSCNRKWQVKTKELMDQLAEKENYISPEDHAKSIKDYEVKMDAIARILFNQDPIVEAPEIKNEECTIDTVALKQEITKVVYKGYPVYRNDGAWIDIRTLQDDTAKAWEHAMRTAVNNYCAANQLDAKAFREQIFNAMGTNGAPMAEVEWKVRTTFKIENRSITQNNLTRVSMLPEYREIFEKTFNGLRKAVVA